jgi:hypothetical protein
MACTKSGAVSSSHFAERLDCETARPANNDTKSAIRKRLRPDFILHLLRFELAILLRAAICGHDGCRNHGRAEPAAILAGRDSTVDALDVATPLST